MGGEMIIYKYPIPIEDEFTIDMPLLSTILKFSLQNGEPFIWVSHNLGADNASLRQMPKMRSD